MVTSKWICPCSTLFSRTIYLTIYRRSKTLLYMVKVETPKYFQTRPVVKLVSLKLAWSEKFPISPGVENWRMRNLH